MSEIQIEKKVPIPSINTGSQSKYPFEKMQPGDSFFVAQKRWKSGGWPAAQAASVYTSRKDNGAKFATRTVTENGKEGVRIWRVK